MNAHRVATVLVALAVTVIGVGSGDIAVAAAAPASGQPGGTITVIDAAAVTGPLTVTLDGVVEPQVVPFGGALPASRVSSGAHSVSVEAPEGSASSSVDVGPSCSVDLVVWRSRGVRGPLALQPLPECPIPAVGAGQASVRLIVATQAAGALTLQTGAGVASAAPGAASTRLAITPGPAQVGLVRQGVAGTWRSVSIDALANHAYDLVVAGDGDTPVTEVSLDVAQGPAQPLPAGTRINTDIVVVPHHGVRGGALFALGLALVVALGTVSIFGDKRGRPMLLVAAVGVVLVLLAGCTRSPWSRVSSSSSSSSSGSLGVALVDGSGNGSVSTTGASAGGALGPAGGDFDLAGVIQGPGIDAPIHAVSVADLPSLPAVLAPGDVDWVQGSAVPGDRGVAILVGHIDWGSSSAAFTALTTVPSGAVFTVTEPGHATTTWQTEASMIFVKAQLPSWLSAPQQVPLLALVTCTGDVVAHSHLDNLVVLAHQISPQ